MHGRLSFLRCRADSVQKEGAVSEPAADGGAPIAPDCKPEGSVHRAAVASTEPSVPSSAIAASKCIECADAPATRACITCVDNFCDACYAVNHRSGSRLLHKWRALVPPKPAQPSPDRGNAAVGEFDVITASCASKGGDGVENPGGDSDGEAGESADDDAASGTSQTAPKGVTSSGGVGSLQSPAGSPAGGGAKLQATAAAAAGFWGQ